MRSILSLSATVFAALASSASASPEEKKVAAPEQQCRGGVSGPVLTNNFPDPGKFHNQLGLAKTPSTNHVTDSPLLSQQYMVQFRYV